MPRLQRHVVSKILDTADSEVGQQPSRKMSTEGPAKLEKQGLVQVERVVDKEWAAQMRFSAEKITICVMPASDKNAEDPVFCANNGDLAPVSPRPGWLYRGHEYTVERRFLESLLRAKIISYAQRKETDPNGVTQIISVPTVACRYQVRKIRDDNPLGDEWFKHVMLEAP